jgi:glycine/D-amino acid oxidase-like deaminating enzyme
VSFWHTQIGFDACRPRLIGHAEADVCIVGGGLTGLWTAYYLKKQNPGLTVMVLEREFAGFGASGRHGGWLSNELAGSRAAMAATYGRASVTALLHEMNRSVSEVIRVCEDESIDADVQRDGFVIVARNPAQKTRLRTEFEEEMSWGTTTANHLLDKDSLASRVNVNGATEGLFNEHAARVHPAKLIRGVARAATNLGVKIYEQTEVTEIRPGIVTAITGSVRAQAIIDCLEGFNSSLKSDDRTVIPLNSAMIVTERIPEATWKKIGWPTATLVGDKAHAFMYAQRTADGRIALGGRGVPYRFGSRTDHRGITQQRTVRQLSRVLHSMFPATESVGIEHAWCGVLGVRRNWTPSISYDPATGLGRAGGYVGNGVSTTNLAGRTMACLVAGDSSPLTELPLVDTTSRRWEPEPFRWAGATLIYGLYRAADRREWATSQHNTHFLARAADVLSGR